MLPHISISDYHQALVDVQTNNRACPRTSHVQPQLLLLQRHVVHEGVFLLAENCERLCIILIVKYC